MSLMLKFFEVRTWSSQNIMGKNMWCRHCVPSWCHFETLIKYNLEMRYFLPSLDLVYNGIFFVFLSFSRCLSAFSILYRNYTSSQRGFMGTIAGDYNLQHSVNRRKSPAIYRSVSSGYVNLAEHDGWHCRSVIRKFHPRKFHPRKFHPAKIPPSENSTQRKLG